MMQNPFKFLDAYGKDDRDRFFGRDREIAQLFNAVHASNLVLIYGRSGTGKTSIVQCGLANKFDDTDWLPVTVRRRDGFERSLRAELLKQLKRAPDPSSCESLAALVRELFIEHYRPVYLIFDQFEELYTIGDEHERNAAYQAVKSLLTPGLPCKLLLVIREEYVAELSALEEVVPQLFDNRIRIETMNNRNLARVIVGTTRYGGITIQEPEVTVRSIIENVRDNRKGVALPNLQIYLDRLFQKAPRAGGGERDSVSFDPALVASTGRFEQVFSDFVLEQLSGLESRLAERQVAQPKGLPLEVLFTMVTGDGTKRALDVAEIREKLPANRKGVAAADVSYCLEEFVRLRLLRPVSTE
jgi:hypothetical protein